MLPYFVVHFFITSIFMHLYLKIFKRNLDQFAQRLRNKHVVVTGGSSGIGRAIAEIAVRSGAHVTVIAKSERKLFDTVETLQRNARNSTQIIKYVALDCSDDGKVEKELLDLDGAKPVYMLANCAEISIPGKLEEISCADVKRMTEVNYYGTVFPTKALLPKMKHRKEGVIIITGSQVSLLGLYGYTPYSATQFALRGFAESLNQEVCNYNIDVTLAVPPDTKTPSCSSKSEMLSFSKLGGVYNCKKVANTIVGDALDAKFFSCVGLTSFLMTSLCAGMSPLKSPLQFLWETLAMGWLRFIGGIYFFIFYRIIHNAQV